MSPLEATSVIRVDSAEEQYAYLTASFGSPGLWTVDSQQWSSGQDGEAIEVATVRLHTGESITLRFGSVFEDDDSFDGSPERDDNPSTRWLDSVMEAAVAFSRDNPPHHPGTIARFPVPAAGYANALSVPMGLIAVDGSAASLFAPPRIVALTREFLEPIGVGEFPGFDPELWPPERLAPWPLPSLQHVGPEQLQGIIHRFSACWSRVISCWFDQNTENSRFVAEDVRAALRYRSQLDVPAMDSFTDQMNPVFAAWIRDTATMP
ncbi:MAG: hypothetical protein WKF81_13055 [Thermomicrobiales bacterium]